MSFERFDRNGTAPPGTSLHRIGSRARVAIWRHRWLLGAFALYVAARSLLPLLIGPQSDDPPVAVLTRAMEAGAELGPGDVTMGRLAGATDTTGFAADPADLVGARLAIALPSGMPVADALLAEPVSGHRAPAGRVVVPVRFSDTEVARLMRPGQRIEVLAGSGNGSDSVAPATSLATGALVLATSTAKAADPLTGDDGVIALLAVTRQEARLISGASAWATLSAAWLD